MGSHSKTEEEEEDDKKDDVLHRIENDDYLKRFFTSGSAKSVLNSSLSITEQVKKLGESIDQLNRELQKQVLEKHTDLLQQASHATKLEEVLNTMNMHVQSLFANAERLNTQISVPYNELEQHTTVLGRLHLASHILRQVNRLQQLSKRLSSTVDPVHKATILQELENLASDPELEDIDAVTTELRNIRAQQQKIVQMANGYLHQGINHENVTQTTTALQIFVNLEMIKSTIDSFVEHSLYECREGWKSAFEIASVPSKSKGGAGHVQLSFSQGFRNKTWNELEKVFSEDIYLTCKHVKFLQNTLDNLHVQNINVSCAEKFWKDLGKFLEDDIGKSSSAVQQMLEEDYPKLLKCYTMLIKKLKYDCFIYDSKVLKKLESSYLSTSLSKMLEPTQSMLSGEGAIPSHDQIDSLIRIVTGELSIALVEENLSEQVSKNVAKCIKMFAMKVEQQVESGPEAAQVIGGAPNVGQQKNVNLANSLHYLQVQVQRMLSNMKESLTDPCMKVINASLKTLNDLTAAIIQPLIVSMNAVIETIIVTIHLETDWAKLNIPPNKHYHSCSPYMKELNEFVTRAYNIYLAKFENKEVLTSKCGEISMRTIDLFIRHSSLLRPLSQGGRIRLQSDFQHLENTLKLIYPQLADLAQAYRLLKSMATLITLSPEEIVSRQMKGSCIPDSTVLFTLFAFAGPDLASPHQNTSWSLPKLSAWLDEHKSEADRLDLIAGALQKYEQIVRQKESDKYDPVYPIMSQFLEHAIKQTG